MDAEKITEWTQDCQGKQDYDADLVTLSSRYWPRGGGFHTYDSQKRAWEGNEARPEIKPSAASSIYVGEDEIVTAEFEADTEEEVKAQVETWAAEKVALIRAAVIAALRSVAPAGAAKGDQK